MEIIKFIKEWTLPCAMAAGACVYLLFAEVPFLEPVGEAVGPWFLEILPVLIFMTLYVTFCKIRLHDLRLRSWHVLMQAIRIAMAGALVVAVKSTADPTLRLALEGAFAVYYTNYLSVLFNITPRRPLSVNSGERSEPNSR